MAANKAVIKTLKILELISKSDDGLTLSDIYKELNMPKATVFDILQALYNEDAIYFKNEDLKTYVIGSKIFTIGQSYIKNSNFINFSEPLLKEFALKYGVTTFASKRIGTKVTYVYKYESKEARLTTKEVGTQFSLIDNVTGLAFLAYLPTEKVLDLEKRILTKELNNKKTENYNNMLKKVEEYRKNPYIFENGTVDEYICEIAVPVYNFESKMTGVISATRLTINDNVEKQKEYIEDFIKIAEVISYKQGYRK